ncbi:hypothetical protein NEICINOT_03505 [Neisseria cinerea ATCC 14685]|uniref:Uncharacterized protein n=1 Tax=Neisseria cinerea ATCC 14685 TaxID=546262 RepID=D0W1I2_NEICI|nr:hypothetical protein NEICINOT_03505 [Neisseria cinerea ATCC 14685]
MGQVFRQNLKSLCQSKTSRNPRFVGQVFRRSTQSEQPSPLVVIPDLWGKSSDAEKAYEVAKNECRNPRFVGQVFRLEPEQRLRSTVES